ncbi:MAG TPA: CHAD domain-containing protein [Solirubrobacteraceae bacterium]|nr:CHAD domain-containing protein [Solirubrobacteraceae bacterium]
MNDRDDPNQTLDAGLSPADQAKLVHEARKAIKRMRALARLLSCELGEQEFKRVNGSLRGAAQRLGGARDAEVRLATLERLIRRHPKALASEGVEQLRLRLEQEREQQPPHRQDVLEDIADMRRELARWNLVDVGFPALAPGLQRIYREGRHRYKRVRRGHGHEATDMHDWRKRVKALYYALDMLGGGKSKGTRRSTRRASRLGDLLGEEHDLWMLAVYLQERPEALGADGSARSALLRSIARRRKRLRKRALKLGARLYKRRSAAFTRGVGDSLSG